VHAHGNDMCRRLGTWIAQLQVVAHGETESPLQRGFDCRHAHFTVALGTMPITAGEQCTINMKMGR
jgi:hypothetical protein